MSIYFKDQKKLHEKIARIQSQGPSSFHVVSDFDLTLTKSSINGKHVPSLFGLIRSGNYLSRDYPQKAYKLYDKYRPLEMDVALDNAERAVFMREWWTTHLQLMIDEGMHKDVLEQVLHDYEQVFKDDCNKLFSLLEENGVPLLVFSSGLGDLIILFLDRGKLLSSNVHVIANFFSFDDSGKVIGYKDDLIIHSFNKSEVVLEDAEHFSIIKDRKNVVLIGDSLGDPHMVDGLSHDTVIKVGFLYDETKLKEYLSLYDVVLVEEESLSYLIDLCSLLMKK